MLKITFDGLLDIAVGKSRKQKIWNNKKVKWSALVEKLSVTHRTAETHAEYINSKPGRQDEIKDIGGFVGGYLVAGKRGNGHVGHRQIITLDIDRGSLALWNDFILIYGCAACIYTTHKHSGEAARMRLVIPLNREIFADEYEPICRRIAESLGIENFTDVTTYEATRLMYWPSTSKYGEFFFDVQDGEWLSADSVLGSYKNWTDSSEWPVCSIERDLVRSDIKKQQDPLEKPGIIGAFCRVYGITEAIEKYLPDVYATTVDSNRYTYAHGSTAGGLVIYEDKFAYSHHGTDPISGKLCNAFDLVRVHKFGANSNSLEDMQRLAAKDKAVVKQLGVERIESAKTDFQKMAGIEPGEQAEPEQEDSREWMKELDVDKKGNYASSIDNIYRVLKNDSKLKGRLYFDDLEKWLKVKGNLPWRVVKEDSEDFSDNDADCLSHYIECYGIPFTHLLKAVSMISNDNRVHPVRDYLNSLYWDGVERLENLLIDYLGAEDNEYVKEVTKRTFIGAVERIVSPGCKVDTVLTLVGGEGEGKSTLIKKMGCGWSSDCLGDIHDKSGMESLRGVWLMEIAELAGIRKADQEAIKRFISSQVDIYRPAYGRQQARYPRQCIFIATTNTDDFLQGAHMHRRFLPVKIDAALATKNIFTGLLQAEIDQVWAEAFACQQAGESADLSLVVKQMAIKVREQHTEKDDREGLIREFLKILLPIEWDILGPRERAQFVRTKTTGDFDKVLEGTEERMFVSAQEIWCELFDRRQSDMNRQNTKFIHDILKRLKGWRRSEKLKRFSWYGPCIGYEKVL